MASAADPLKNVSMTRCSAARWAVLAGTTGVYTYKRPTVSCRTYPFVLTRAIACGPLNTPAFRPSLT